MTRAMSGAFVFRITDDTLDTCEYAIFSEQDQGVYEATHRRIGGVGGHPVNSGDPTNNSTVVQGHKCCVSVDTLSSKCSPMKTTRGDAADHLLASSDPPM
jgi:hypothetical protein